MKKIKLLTLAIFSSTCFMFAGNCDEPMHEQMFMAVKNSATHKTSEAHRLEYVKGSVSRVCVTSKQAMDLIVLFKDEANRQSFYDFVKEHTTDADNLGNVEALIKR